MAELGVDLSALPKEVRDQVAELDLELSEGKSSQGVGGLLMAGWMLAVCLGCPAPLGPLPGLGWIEWEQTGSEQILL